MTDWVIGCTHFGHANIIRLCNRPFASVKEMDRAMIDNWNRVVGPRDTVYHLGDFAFRGPPAEHYERQLRGTIVKIRGNHDSEDWGTPYLRVRVNRTGVVLFHYPIQEWDGWWQGAVHLHAHTHDREFLSATRRGNVSADAVGFTPVRLDHCVERLLASGPAGKQG